MNKSEARKQALANKRTIGELLALVDARATAADGKMSRVNRQILLARACEIYAGALAGRPTESVPTGIHTDVYRNRDRISGDGMIIQNILRDCA